MLRFFRRRKPRLKTTTGFNCPVAGTSYYQENIEAAVGGKIEGGHGTIVDAVLRLDDKNEHDENAVAVLIHRKQVGFLSRKDAVALRSAITDRTGDMRVKARVSGGWSKSELDSDEGYFGIKLAIARPPKLIDP
ncbi:HIRAN domain-containing protein [Palleronia sp. LCG004]|uniref:HIRAN domain-containing protein n=1 Tax=Palleronia sp. LCG004 TaxID=3079304 RepID=UPI0029425A21|nr:HIRAN domain-containing protein [Palleronia sp. LCG004]WOI54976.1 HIRAN domain-containing protein [Palleronia sp. LCG004]